MSFKFKASKEKFYSPFMILILGLMGCAEVKMIEKNKIPPTDAPQSPNGSENDQDSIDSNAPAAVADAVKGTGFFAIQNSAVPFSCSDNEETLKKKKVTSLTQGDTTFYIGYEQVTSDNQDPRLARFDKGTQAWCRSDLEKTSDDSKGYALLWDGAKALYGVFSSTGTQGQPEQDFRRFAKNGWLTSYGPGGGAKVSVVAAIDVVTGNPQGATFISAYLESKKKVNSLSVTAMSFNDSGHITIEADTTYAPRRANTQVMTCTDYPAKYKLIMGKDLNKVLQATADNCQ